EAQSQNKPILLSIGYAACHWCHVMAHESFENDAIAAVMNKLFINIKVDREERPDLDVIYQSALHMMGQQGGWPLTMFLTPDGHPFWGGTYFPATARYGRPGFGDLIQSISHTFFNEPENVRSNVDALRHGLEENARPTPGDGLTMDIIDEVANRASNFIDMANGGTQGAPKFPQPDFFNFLWRAAKRTGSSRLSESVILTLDKICQGGIYDHLGGGFARYSTDDIWLAPHFEKMLYDNALLIELMTEVWQETRSPLLATRIRETITWALREMVVRPDDNAASPFAFASAYDADSEGEEGKFYVWNEAEIDSLLGDSSENFKSHYEIHPFGNWEGKTILNRTANPTLGTSEEEQELTKARDKLLQVRNDRIWPLWDDKVLADWNGLMITALTKAGTVFDEPEWLEAAKSAYQFVCTLMVDQGHLNHTWREGRLRYTAILDDYANMTMAAITLYEHTGDTTYLDQAVAWVTQTNEGYWDDENGGYFLTAASATDVITRSKTVTDNATPSGNGTMMNVLARLFTLTGNTDYRDRADAMNKLFSSPEIDRLVGQTVMLCGFELLALATQIVVVGEPDDPDTKALLQTVHTTSVPTQILLQLSPDAPLPPDHPAHGKGLIDGKPAAYICIGPTCSPPQKDPAALAEALSKT
ncbi:MAG: thioredoxin domain-containing protein, partial [Rhodospirillales bacterium]|nr:thioredoxin domain-containing protein [Rhodospirillales bacterium]